MHKSKNLPLSIGEWQHQEKEQHLRVMYILMPLFHLKYGYLITLEEKDDEEEEAAVAEKQ